MKQLSQQTISGLHLPSLTITDLENLLHTVKQFHIDRIRFTPNNQIAVSGVADEVLPHLTRHLATFMKKLPANGISAILSCPGCNSCKHGKRDTALLAEQLERLTFPGRLPAKCKIAIAGCRRCCTMPFVRDIGLIPSRDGWQLIFGGNGGANPRIGTIVADGISTENVPELVSRCLLIYQKYAGAHVRASRFIEAFGEEQFIREMNDK